MAAAPLPRSHEEMYWMPTLTSLRTPCSVMASRPPAEPASRRSEAVTCTSSRWRSSWLGRSPRTSSNCPRATGTESGWATQEPSNPSSASRALSAATPSNAWRLRSSSVRDGTTAAMPPIAWASRR